MEVTPIPTAVAPEINWSVPNVLHYHRETTGTILFINVIGMDTESDYLALCIYNTSSMEEYVPGKLYPGSSKNLFILYDGAVTLNN